MVTLSWRLPFICCFVAGAYLGHALEMPGLLDDPAGETQGSVVIPQHVHDEAEFNVHFRSLKEEHMAYPPPYPPPVIDDTPQIAINETADEPPAGTGAAEATESITRSTITINSSLFDNAEAKAALVDDMLENSGIPPSGLGRRKDPSPQAQDSLPLRRTANNMLEDALQGAVTSTAGNIRLFRDEEDNDIGIDIRLFYPEGTPAETRAREADIAGRRLRDNTDSPRYRDGLEQAVRESGEDLDNIEDIVNSIGFAAFEGEAVEDGAFALKAGVGALLASIAAITLLV